MRHVLISAVLVIFLTAMVSAQMDITMQALDDMETELDHNEITLRFFDALNGEPLTEAIVGIENVGILKTDTEGKVRFKIPPDGTYRMIFKKEGYVKSVIPLNIVANTLIFNRFSISPSMPVGSVRLVLDWGQEPSDLDAHFVKKGAYHIAYHNRHVSDDGVSMLDRDDTDSYGPETITSKEIDPAAEYNYFVHNYSGQGESEGLGLSRSRGHVKVFGNDQLMHTVEMAPNQPGVFWEVLRIVNGEYVIVNQLKSSEPE